MPLLDYPAITAVDVAILRPNPELADPNWVLGFLNSPGARSQVMNLSSGTTRLRISRKNLGSVLVPVPPLAEQNRLVGKFEEIENAIRSIELKLHGSEDLIESGRASVFHRAFSGPEEEL